MPALTELEADEAIARMRDDEAGDLDADCQPPVDGDDDLSLVDRYQALLADQDMAIRAMAGEQLRRLEAAGYREAGAYPASPAAGADLPALARGCVPVQRRGADRYECGCPAGHASKSGLCATLWHGDGGWRWYCRSCRRGGDAIAWTMLAEGLAYRHACIRLGIEPKPPAGGTRRPPAGAVALTAGWRPSGIPIPAGWRPGRPLAGEAVQ